MMCLGQAHGEYNRAKVLAIECDPKVLVTVFFVDLGEHAVFFAKDLLAIPDYLVNKEPFQVISFFGILRPALILRFTLSGCSMFYDWCSAPQ